MWIQQEDNHFLDRSARNRGDGRTLNASASPLYCSMLRRLFHHSSSIPASSMERNSVTVKPEIRGASPLCAFLHPELRLFLLYSLFPIPLSPSPLFPFITPCAAPSSWLANENEGRHEMVKVEGLYNHGAWRIASTPRTESSGADRSSLLLPVSGPAGVLGALAGKKRSSSSLARTGGVRSESHGIFLV